MSLVFDAVVVAVAVIGAIALMTKWEASKVLAAAKALVAKIKAIFAKL